LAISHPEEGKTIPKPNFYETGDFIENLEGKNKVGNNTLRPSGGAKALPI
jgi:hypothetical protein